MKSEERHKLQQNELADFIAKWMTSLKPYQNTIFGGLIVMLLVVLLLTWWRRESSSALTTANDDFFMALNSFSTADLAKVAEDHPKSKIAAAAAVAAAEIHLNRGTNLLFQNEAVAKQELQSAIELYQKALDLDPEDMLREQALYGMARAEESRGKLKEASENYQKVIDQNPEGAYAGIARQRWESLKRLSIKKFYDKFAEYHGPKPAIQESPNQGKELDFNNLPKEGPVYQPQDPLKLGPLSDEKKSGQAAGETKPQETKSPPSETPASPSTPPTAKTPAQPSTPSAKPDSEKKPAETPPVPENK
jgi:tetratricopeptide (TPR) repeat protein